MIPLVRLLDWFALRLYTPGAVLVFMLAFGWAGIAWKRLDLWWAAIPAVAIIAIMLRRTWVLGQADIRGAVVIVLYTTIFGGVGFMAGMTSR